MRLAVTILLLFMTQLSFAQSSISLSFPSDTIAIGQPVMAQLRISADLANIEQIDFSALLETENQLYEFDTTLLEKYFDVSIGANNLGISNDRLLLRGSEVTTNTIDLPLTFFTMGVGAFPNPTMQLRDSTAVLPLQPSLIYVKPPDGFANQLDSLQLQGIKPIIEEGAHWTDYLPILYVVGGLFLLGGIFYLILRRRKEEDLQFVQEEEVVVIPAHTKAVAALQELDSQQLWQQGKVKAYQSELTKIMRAYVSDRYDIAALEMTSTDIKKSLVAEGLDDELVKSMADIMQIADIVKFAKGTAGPELNQKFMTDAFDWVAKTKVEEIAE